LRLAATEQAESDDSATVSMDADVIKPAENNSPMALFVGSLAPKSSALIIK